MEYYIVQFNEQNSTKYAIWYTDVEDGFICEDGKILFFDSVKLLKVFCDTKKIIITDEEKASFVYDFGYLKKWILFPTDNFDCSDMLDFWNIISDASKSLGVEFIGDDKEKQDINQLYSKLYHGCNLPVINKSRKKYIPEWKQEEIDRLAEILSEYTILV